MEKAIEIKRRAQRCVQNGDVDGALREYEKLVETPESDPYNFVLLADLLYKKGEQGKAAERYLSAVTAYEKAGLYKNAIAVCKKMSRLSLSPSLVLKHLAGLHALDGLAGEAAMYYAQYADYMMRANSGGEAIDALRKAFDLGQENVKVLEQLSEVLLLEGQTAQAAEVMREAAGHWETRGQAADARRCHARANLIDPASAQAAPAASVAPAPLAAPVTTAAELELPPRIVLEPVVSAPEPALVEPEAAPSAPEPVVASEPAVPAPVVAPEPVASAPEPVVASEPVAPAPPPVVAAEPVASAPEPVAPAPPAPVAGAPEPLLVTPDTLDDMPAPQHATHGVNGFAPAAPEPVTSSTESPYDDRPEPPPTGGILTGSRIPGLTAPSLGPVSPEIESGPSYAPAAFEGGAPQGFTQPPVFGAVAPPPADLTGFDRPATFTAPVSSADAAMPPAPDDASTAEGVYEIGSEEVSSYEAALREVEQPGAVAPRPTPFAAEPVPAEPTPSMIARRPEEILGGVANVEGLLQRAQEEFRAGRRDSASQALVEAALAYERLGRLDSAATIFRSLGRGANAPIGVMELWLANCEKRNDPAEGSQVACELGDRALNDGQEAQARRWFEHALGLEPSNDTARRRIQRMASRPAAAEPAAPAAPESGRVAVAVGRGQAVTFDLQGLLQEFQRGVESQLEGDAQGHYDLGMAYREMGLHDEAIGAFRIAERDPRLTQRALEMIGRSLADSSRYDEAVREFESALRLQPLDAGAEAELRFQMAMSYAATGQMADAMAQMEIADMRFPGRPDIQQRLAEWRRAFGQAA